jgi:integrase
VSVRYSRFVATLDVAHTTFHKLRHYSATELVAAGIDINTVAGRLGHASATTTYNFYAAWKAELDQRAAIEIHGRVPTPPAPAARAAPRRTPVSEVLAQRLRAAILDGRSAPGTHLPPMKDLATEHRVSINAAHAAPIPHPPPPRRVQP